jgi:hypothetical protein
MFSRNFGLVWLIALAVGVGRDQGASFKHRNDPENLKALFEGITILGLASRIWCTCIGRPR